MITIGTINGNRLLFYATYERVDIDANTFNYVDKLSQVTFLIPFMAILLGAVILY